MTERHKQLVLAIETIADDFTSDRRADENAYWSEWFEGRNNLSQTVFAEFKKLQEEYLSHPDYNKILFDGEYVDKAGLKELSEHMRDTRKQFNRIVLPVMLRDTGANKIQQSITKIDGSTNGDGSHRVVTDWGLLHDNQDLNDKAWAHIGKALTYRLFDRNYSAYGRGRGRPKELRKDKEAYVARRVIELKRALYRPYYSLAPFSDVEIITALLSNPQHEKLRAVLARIGLKRLISVERVCNMMSAGRKELSGFWLSEDSHAMSEIEDYYEDEGITIEQRIAFAEDELGLLSEEDKDAIRQGFACPTEIKRALLKPDLKEVDLEEVMRWNLMPAQIVDVIAVAKSKFGLSAFKSEAAQKKAQDYW